MRAVQLEAYNFGVEPVRGQLVPLTDKQISAVRPGEKKYKLFDEKGLFLLVVPHGGKYWKFKYTRAGRAHEVALGAYPEVSLKVARDRRVAHDGLHENAG